MVRTSDDAAADDGHTSIKSSHVCLVLARGSLFIVQHPYIAFIISRALMPLRSHQEHHTITSPHVHNAHHDDAIIYLHTRMTSIYMTRSTAVPVTASICVCSHDGRFTLTRKASSSLHSFTNIHS